MVGNYTQAANDRCFQLMDEDIYRIWDTIEGLSEDETAGIWKEKCEALSEEYSYSSRFALIRILNSREPDRYPLPETGIDAVMTLTDAELKKYAEALGDLAAGRKGAEPEYNAYLIARALRDTEESLRLAETGVPEGADRKELNRIRKECKTLLSREEAFQLGHILGFTLEEMSWFLLRVFDFEDGFRYNSSQDLIEAYTFLTDGSWKDAEILKQAYASAASLVPKAETEGRDADWTQGTEISLKDMVEEWNGHPQDRDHRFLLWLSGQAPYLDMPSRTAGAVYRKLALYFYELGTGQIPVPGREAFIREIRKRTDGKTPEMDEKTCRTLSAGLLESNKNLYTSAPDRAKAWRTVSSDANGLPRLIMAGRPDASRSRVQDLLAGEEQVEKGDMLHLLWYGFNLCWGEDPILNDMFELQCNLADFLECAETVLDAALLPPFYPPHMMEQSMMLSIICCVEDTGIPAYNYAELCESLIRPRDRKKKQKAG